MTARELEAKLAELPEHLKDMRVLVETEEGGRSELTSIRAQIEGSKIWWEPDALILSGNY